jgi:DNA-binding XRE family transcriptional regulator
VINVAQIRAARGLLKWTQATLAYRAAISTVTLNMIENETVRPRETTLDAIRAALEAGGVRFVEENGVGIGVRFAPNTGPDGNGEPRLPGIRGAANRG